MSITRRVSKDGKVSYRVKVHLGYEGENGKGRRTVTKTCATKKEALAVEAQLKTQPPTFCRVTPGSYGLSTRRRREAIYGRTVTAHPYGRLQGANAQKSGFFSFFSPLAPGRLQSVQWGPALHACE